MPDAVPVLNVNKPELNRKLIHIIQGDQALSDNRDDVMTTILGSCVATCLYDPIANVGGMNHFLLPGENKNAPCSNESYGLNAMELLINGLLKMGAKRNRFEAKLFGGARMIEGLSDIGMQNAKFAIEFLAFEGIPCVSKSLGGLNARRIRFWPGTGRVQMKSLAEAAVVAPIIAKKPAVIAPNTSDLELF